MPLKRQWERLHRSGRLARRRELRQAEAAREAAQPDAARLQTGAGSLLLPLAAGSVLAVYNPKLAIGLVASRWQLPRDRKQSMERHCFRM
jgi:hypothetical protein